MDRTEEHFALMYMKRSEEALEILVGERWDADPASMRIRAYLAQDQQLRNIERQYPEYMNTFAHLRNNYSPLVEAALHSLVDRNVHKLDSKLPQAIEDFKSRVSDFPLAA